MTAELDTTWTRKRSCAFSGERANRIARNSVTSMDVMAAARDISRMRSYTDTYGIAIAKTGEITNQRQSGRCWMFSAFNVLRQETMRFLDVDTFEFSQSFGMFYDKLEKANATLERIIDTADLPTDSREVEDLLEDGLDDGGYYPFAMNIVRKWGLVPKDAMGETACSKNSAQMDGQLNRALRRAAGILRSEAQGGVGTDDLRARKQELLADVHQILCVCLGEPPARFDLELKVGKDCKADPKKLFPIEPAPQAKGQGQGGGTGSDAATGTKDKDEKPSQILRDLGLTPLEFVERYVPTDPTAYVSLVSIPSERFPYGRVYRLLRTDSFIAGMRTRFLNVEPELLDQAAIASLKDGRPLAMACDVMQNFPRHIEDFKYVLSTDAVDVDGLFGIDLSMSRTDMLDLHETSLTHAMTFQGVELDGNGSPKAWRVENSWGKDAGKDGYLIMSADWFHLYGGEIDVRCEYVPTELLDSWDDESQDIEVEPWSSMGRALGAGKRD